MSQSPALAEGLDHARQLADSGRKAEAVAALVTAARAADPASAADLLVEAAYLALWVHGPERALALATEASALAAGTGGAPELRAMTRLGDALLWCGRYAEAQRAWQGALDVPAPADAAVLCERANAQLRSGDLAAAKEASYEATVVARATGTPGELLDALSLTCVTEIHLGALREALLCAEQSVAVAVAEEDRAGVAQLDALGLLAWVTALLGEVDLCRGALATAREVVGALPMTAPGGLAEGMLALGQGDLGAAAHAFEAKLRELPVSPVAQACGLRPFVPSLVEAYARTGQVDRARQLADELVPAVLATGQPRLVAPVLRAHAVAHGELASFAEAHCWHARWGNLLEEGRTFLAEGELLRRGKQRERARVALRAALDRFEHVGAATWSARAATELRAAGDRSAARPAPTTAGPVRLTQQETAIVDLLRRGLSNRELAAQLFLSVKTVEGHLTAIYDKVGVRSRSQLMAALAGAAD